MIEWRTASEYTVLGLPDLPTTPRGFNKLAKEQGWAARQNVRGEALSRRRKGRGGGTEYHYTVLPSRAQQALVAREVAARREVNGATAKLPKGKGERWQWFDGLPASRKDKAQERLDALDAIAALQRGGLQKNVAVAEIASRIGVGPSTVYSWFELVQGLDRAEWLPALAPRHGGRQKTVDCDPRAWEFLKADYLRLAKPSFTSCYRRLQAAAGEQGWTIPSERTLVRRIETEIPEAMCVLAREGEDALKRMYPAQERDRTQLHALEAVNLDGHVWDVFVRWPDGAVGRPVMVAVQDLYSNKILAWRIDRSENSDSIRLAFADTFRRYGLPDRAYMDNGRGFASKFITGGTPNRYRFKVKAEEPSGILTSVGVQVHWTRPYSGQSKPIERAFRDFCDAIAKHPAFEGAYTGNKPEAKPENYGSRAIPIETFNQIVDQGIAMHNAREGRNTRVCQRRLSFDQAFEQSYTTALIRKATEEQLRMCLMAAESVKADQRSGAIRLLGNRYWSEAMHDLRGRPVTVRFDPDNLYDGIHVYRLDGSFAGFADCIELTGFEDTAAARDHARNRKQFIKAHKAMADAERRMSLDELAALLPRVEEAEPPEAATVRPLFTGSAALKAQPEPEDQEDSEVLFFEQLGAGLRIAEAEKE